VATITLSQGKATIVDDEDFPVVSQFGWFAYRASDRRDLWYAARNVGHGRGNRRIVTMHRFLFGLQPGDGLQVDHRNGDGLDNQRHNLRVCSHRDNHRNLPKWYRLTSSIYKGVSWSQRHGKWIAQIQPSGIHIHLGYHLNEQDAARAYDAAAVSYFGEFARLNFPQEIAS
jgi:hypothetical protein